MNLFLKMYFCFIVYSFLGWVVQGIYVGFKKRHFVNTGFLYGPYVPIYGFGALIVLFVLAPISANGFFLFFGAVILTSILEYFTSWALQKLFHRQWWNYSKRPFNLHGRICLLNSTLYGIGALVIYYGSQPYVNEIYDHFTKTGIIWFESVFSVIFFSDLALTLHHMWEHKHMLEKVHAHVQAINAHLESTSQTIAQAVQTSHIAQHVTSLQQVHDQIHAHASARLSKAFQDARLAEPYATSMAHAKELLNNVKSSDQTKE